MWRIPVKNYQGVYTTRKAALKDFLAREGLRRRQGVFVEWFREQCLQTWILERRAQSEWSPAPAN